MKNSIKMSILPLLVCLSLNGKALADLSCDENYKDYIQSSAKTQKLITETGLSCNIIRDYLRWSDFSVADLSEADFSGADLSLTDFSGADLSLTDFSGADLTVANLSGANLSEANLTEAILIGALYDDKTMFPEGFDPVESEMKKASQWDCGDN